VARKPRTPAVDSRCAFPALRRTVQHAFRIGESHQVDPSLNSVTGPAGSTRVEPKVMQVLVCLAEHAGQVVAKERLIRTVWPDTFVSEDVLTRCISELRRVFGDDAKEPRVIQTIPKSGYRLIADVAVSRVEQDSAGARHVGYHEPGSGPGGSANGGARRSWKRGVWEIGLVASVLVGLLIWGWVGSGTEVSRGTTEIPFRTVPLTSLPGQERAPTLSPDGNQVAFSWNGETGNEDIYIQLIGAGTPLRLTSSPASDRNPSWSPDGRYLAFIRFSPNESGIFIIPALGGPERRIAAVNWESRWDLYGAGLSWAPDGEFLAVSDRSAPQDPASLFVLSVDGLVRRKLTPPPAESIGDLAPAISADGQTVAFLRVTSGGVSDIYLVPFVGGEPRRLTFDRAWIERIAWAPNGRELVFSSGGGLRGGGTLWRVSASGGKPERLAMGGDDATYPTVSSRANRLAYVHRSMDANIWRMEIRPSARPAGPPTKLIASTRYEGGPQFSPDGRRIAFHSDRSGNHEVWVCDVACLQPLQLTSLERSNTGTPRWSPDSRRIAFDSRPGQDSDIYVIDADGGAPHRVTTEPSDDVVPSWSSNGRWIYFASSRTGRWEVWKVPSGGGPAVQVTKHGGFAAFESRDGQSVYYAKGHNVRGLWRVSVNGGEETPVLEFPEVGYWGYWAVAEKGIYFVSTGAERFALKLFDFATRRVRHVATLEKTPTQFDSGLGLSPDGRAILYVQEDEMRSDIVLVENFR
jgi:Tol biopolymer transport system component/DNA-binding winged helix-turn-helix (wHTH) protein